jgi:Arc/MetJ-type ribon-helix-helix transcriptional regulator
MKKHDSRTALRLPREQREQIDSLIREGKYRSQSQIIREALSRFLKTA